MESVRAAAKPRWPFPGKVLLVDGQQFDRVRSLNADDLRRVFEWRRHRLRLSRVGKP